MTFNWSINIALHLIHIQYNNALNIHTKYNLKPIKLCDDLITDGILAFF